jgi:LPXTG-motif cell wall-anchored protein
VSSITATSTNDRAHETLNFTATSTPLSLFGSSGQNYIGLDNVAVKAVPLPNLLILLGTGLLAAAAVFFRRRRRTFPQALVA